MTGKKIMNDQNEGGLSPNPTSRGLALPVLTLIVSRQMEEHGGAVILCCVANHL